MENRRSGIERRVFSYTAHIPEKRSGQDRREVGEILPPKSKKINYLTH